jgi:hypothetical protein
MRAEVFSAGGGAAVTCADWQRLDFFPGKGLNAMAQKRHFNPRAQRGGRAPAPATRMLQYPPEVERLPAVVYGKPFIVLEDKEKNTFVYKEGNWVPHSDSIAECRKTCQVKELPQRVNQMIRYEIRCPE